MEAMRQSWTDDRLDDLSSRMDQRFDQVDRRFEKVDQRFDQVDRRFEKVEGEIKSLRIEMNEGNRQLLSRLDQYNDARRAESNALQRTLLQVLGTFGAALIGLIAVVIAQL